MERKSQSSPTSVLKAGAIAFAFLVIGYEVALFVHRASVERIAAMRDHPDTVFVVDSALASRLLGTGQGTSTGYAREPSCPQPRHSFPDRRKDYGGAVVIRKDAEHSAPVERAREATRRVESFRFNPNTAGLEELERLGFTKRQAESILNYRSKGGRFRRKSDFAKSYVVADSVFRRLEPFIDIPKVDINRADSAEFDTLPGIGGYFASKMVSYRAELGGYSYPEQLMDIWHFDREKYDALADLIVCSPPRDSFALWSLPAEELRKHPYVRTWQTARSIVLFRENTARSGWTIDNLCNASILTEENAVKLRRCAVKRPF